MPQNTPPAATQELFFQVWKQCRKETCHPECGGNCAVCRPAPWVVTHLLELLSKERGKAIEELTPSIRKIVEESRFVGSGGEVLTNPPVLAPIASQVNLVVMTLQRMRNAKASWESIPEND